MKIALIGPGIMSIPPPGWGAVEIIIWDYYTELKNNGYDVTIINQMRSETINQYNDTNHFNTLIKMINDTNYFKNLIKEINDGNYDFVHLHYDCYYHILPFLNCKKIGITSHYPYIDNINKHSGDGYTDIFNFLITQDKYYNFVLAKKDLDIFLKYGANIKYIKHLKNGVNSKLFNFLDKSIFQKTIYLGKITSRKNQFKYQSLLNIDFVGNCGDNKFNINNQNYLGEWSREYLHKNLTNYSNLLLISEGEADPLVVKEALIVGLGVVINKSSAENLDCNTDFITIIDDDKINDLNYIQEKINENIQKCIFQRYEIRKYGIDNFDISIQIINYIKLITSIP